MIDCTVTKNYFSEKSRMCAYYDNVSQSCDHCPLNDIPECCFPGIYIDKAISLVQKWSDENPAKTYAQDFLEKYPNCSLKDGRPAICGGRIYGHDCPVFSNVSVSDSVFESACTRCWNMPFEEAKG